MACPGRAKGLRTSATASRAIRGGKETFQKWNMWSGEGRMMNRRALCTGCLSLGRHGRVSAPTPFRPDWSGGYEMGAAHLL